jgi:alpha-mannosidase
MLIARLELALEAFAEHAELSVSFDQPACDQRLRLRLATGIHADHAIADGHWHQERIPLARAEHPDWYQQPVATHHQRRYTAVSDAAAGFALLARGLPEAEAIATPAGVELAVTLIRAVGWLSRDDLHSRPQGAGPALPAPGAQCLGPQRCELAIAPFAGAADVARLQRAAEAFVHPPLVVTAGYYDPRPDLQFAPAGGAAGAATERSASITGVHLSEPLLLTACKPAEEGDGIVVRLWNPTPDRVHGELTLPHDWNLDRILLTRLDETAQQPLACEQGRLAVTLEPSQVLTLRVHSSKQGGPT